MVCATNENGIDTNAVKCCKCIERMTPINKRFQKDRGFYYTCEYNCVKCGIIATVDDNGVMEYFDSIGNKILGGK
jgi:hypothetical protein